MGEELGARRGHRRVPTLPSAACSLSVFGYTSRVAAAKLPSIELPASSLQETPGLHCNSPDLGQSSPVSDACAPNALFRRQLPHDSKAVTTVAQATAIGSRASRLSSAVGNRASRLSSAVGNRAFRPS